MNIRHLRTLVAAVDGGSFASAGEATGVSHSAISLQVKSLEEELGVALFDRSKRPPAPTARGRALADHARKTLDLFDAARAVATGELAALVGVEDLQRPFEKRLLSLMNHRRVNDKPACQLGNRVCSPFRATGATRALNSGLCCLRFVIADILSLRTRRCRICSLRNCPSYRE